MRTFLIILLIGLLGACRNLDYDQNGVILADKLELSKQEVKLTNTEGSFTINVTASGDWTAEVVGTDNEWLTLSKI